MLRINRHKNKPFVFSFQIYEVQVLRYNYHLRVKDTIPVVFVLPEYSVNPMAGGGKVSLNRTKAPSSTVPL